MIWIPFILLDERCRPLKAHETDAGFDLTSREDALLEPSQTKRVPVGVKIALPPGYEAQVRPRSSWSSQGVFVAFGTVDASYRGEIQVVVFNSTPNSLAILAGTRIAQLVVSSLAAIRFQVAETLDTTERGEDGFGSSGVQAFRRSEGRDE